MIIAVPFFAIQRLAMEPSFQPKVSIQAEQPAPDTAYVPLQFSSPAETKASHLATNAVETFSAVYSEHDDASARNL